MSGHKKWSEIKVKFSPKAAIQFGELGGEVEKIDIDWDEAPLGQCDKCGMNNMKFGRKIEQVDGEDKEVKYAYCGECGSWLADLVEVKWEDMTEEEREAERAVMGAIAELAGSEVRDYRGDEDEEGE